MDFNLFAYYTLGRRNELEAGLAGLKNDLYQRMLDEVAQIASAADEWGYAGMGHPEHHLQIEGFETSNDLNAMAMWLGQHTKRMKIISCGWVSTTHNPLRAAEQIATLDHMLKGRFSFGMVRGYQYRWVENFKTKSELTAVGPWNKRDDADELNREHFEEWVEIVLTALREPTFSYEGKFWQFPATGMVNPHPHGVYTEMGSGVRADDLVIEKVGIAPRPYQTDLPTIYGGFGASMRTALFWAKHKGRPIIMSDNLDFCRALWDGYAEEAKKWGHDITPGEQAAWGGIMICAPTDAEAQRQAEDYLWFWDRWSIPFGNPLPKLLVGSPDTLSKMIEEADTKLTVKDCFLLLPQGIQPAGEVLDSLELFATKVLPRFS